MEEQDKRALLTHDRHHTLSPSPLKPHPDLTRSSPSSPSLALTPTAESHVPLSTSEPFLRFPRPVGNRHLANWISSSDPDIMRVTTAPADDVGLVDSSYEIISLDDENSSQDGNDRDTISESISSLDAHRTDDLHSLASTEQMSDDEEDAHDYAQVIPSDSDEPLLFQPANDFDEEDIPDALENVELYPSCNTQHRHSTDSESEDDVHSYSSLEYAQQSLSTPSIPNPDAGKAYEVSVQEASPDPSLWQLVADDMIEILHLPIHVWNAVRTGHAFRVTNRAEVTAIFISFITFTGILAMLISGAVVIIQTSPSQHGMQIPPAVVTTTADATPLLLSTPKPPGSRALESRDHRVDLIPLNNAASHEWIFGTKEPDVSFKFLPAWKSVFVDIPRDVVSTWMYHQCVEVETTKYGRSFPSRTRYARHGMHVTFEPSAYGIVEISFKAHCKPKLHKVVHVDLGEGTLLGRFWHQLAEAADIDLYEFIKEHTSMFTQQVPRDANAIRVMVSNALSAMDNCKKTVSPSVAHYVRRWESLEFKLTDGIVENLNTMHKASSARLDKLRKSSSVCLYKLHRESSAHLEQLRKHSLSCLTNVRGATYDRIRDTSTRVQTDLKLDLLNAQISAKTWWLKMRGLEKESAEYQRKALEFLAKKQAAAKAMTGRETKGADTKTFLYIWLLGGLGGLVI